jgi:signal transduction histidine kinase
MPGDQFGHPEGLVRRRLTVAILGVVVGTLVLTVAGSLLLVRRAAVSTAGTEITTQAQALGDLLSLRGAVFDRRAIAVLKRVGSYDFLGVVALTPSGQFASLPGPLDRDLVDVSAIQAGNAVAGNVGLEVYVAVPVTLTEPERRALAVPAVDQAVLVVTRSVPRPLNGLVYFLLVGGVVLVVGAIVATVLARRISAPLVRAADTTHRIAEGDLDAKVPVGRHDDPELKELAAAINAMGEGLSRSQGTARQFLLSVSHELRTPLTSIRGYADAVTDGATDDVAGAIAVIASEARRLERLVQDLLDLARLDARQFSLEIRPVDCAGVVAAVAEGARPQAAALGIELVVAVPLVGGLWIDADPDRLGQVVANLVENAYKFAARRVVIGADLVAASVVIWVLDDGPGIAPGDLPHVFDRHFTSDRRPARRLGSGLGLAIVAELAAAMDATVRAESPVDEGRGTRVAVWFRPRSTSPFGEAAVTGAPSPGT